jgi:hypothetical protein
MSCRIAGVPVVRFYVLATAGIAQTRTSAAETMYWKSRATPGDLATGVPSRFVP